MPLFTKGDVSIHYEEVGSGFPLLIIPGGGLNSTIKSLDTSVPFNPMTVYKDDFRCIAADQPPASPAARLRPTVLGTPILMTTLGSWTNLESTSFWSWDSASVGQ